MARFKINFINSANITFESVYVVGRKSNVKHDDSDKFDYYYVSKPNEYGIKWVIMNKDSWKGNDISTNKSLPNYRRIEIYKQY